MGIACLLKGHDWEIVKKRKNYRFGHTAIHYMCKRCFAKHIEYEIITPAEVK